MPTVDINAPRQAVDGAKSGFGTGLPTPVLLAVVGGGIGLVVFLTRKNGANPTASDNGGSTVLPNTAIMLGSLQQLLLETEGKVTLGNADLSSQVTGVGENLGSQLDAQSQQIATGFTNANANLTAGLGALTGQQDALASAIAGLGTQNAGLSANLQTILTGLHDTYAQVFAANQGIASTYTQIGGIIQNQNQQAAQLNSLGQQYATVAQSILAAIGASQQAGVTTNMDFGAINGAVLAADGTSYLVNEGKLYNIGFHGEQRLSGNHPLIHSSVSLSQYSSGNMNL